VIAQSSLGATGPTYNGVYAAMPQGSLPIGRPYLGAAVVTSVGMPPFSTTPFAGQAMPYGQSSSAFPRGTPTPWVTQTFDASLFPSATATSANTYFPPVSAPMMPFSTPYPYAGVGFQGMGTIQAIPASSAMAPPYLAYTSAPISSPQFTSAQGGQSVQAVTTRSSVVASASVLPPTYVPGSATDGGSQMGAGAGPSGATSMQAVTPPSSVVASVLPPTYIPGSPTTFGTQMGAGAGPGGAASLEGAAAAGDATNPSDYSYEP